MDQGAQEPGTTTTKTVAGATTTTTTGKRGSSKERGSGHKDKDAGKDKEKEETETMLGQPYYHGHLPREIAETVLNHPSAEDGEFLVRANDRHRNYAIVLRYAGKIRHLKINHHPVNGTYYVDSKHKFPSVRATVEAHWKKAIPAHNMTLKTPAPRSRWELNPANVIKEKKIGEGAFGEVWKCKYTVPPSQPGPAATGAKSTGTAGTENRARDVAVKYCKEKTAEGRSQFEREAMFQLKFRHENIVETVGVCMKEASMMIVLEFMPKGSLRDYVAKEKARLRTRQLLKFCVDACAGMAYLEAKHIIHRDVAARNCLVGAHEEVKIADFGLAKATDKYKMLEGKVSVKWMAPESMREGSFTGKTDVYSFGILMWEVFSFGVEPYPGVDTREVRRLVSKEYRHLEPPPNAPPIAASAMISCWAKEPANRPRFAALLPQLNLAGAPAAPPPATTPSAAAASAPSPPPPPPPGNLRTATVEDVTHHHT